MAAQPWYLSQPETAALADIKRRVAATFPVVQFVLFGSKARGDFELDSDVDLLIVTERPLSRAEKHSISHEITAVNRLHGTLFSFVAIDSAQWKSEIFSALPLHRQVEREGVVV